MTDEEKRKQAEERREERRQQRAASETPSSEQEPAARVEPVALETMLAEGGFVQIGDSEYEVAAFPLSKLAKAGKLIALCPEMLVTAALSADNGVSDAARVTEVTNRLVTQAKALSPGTDVPQMDGEMIAYAMSTLALEVSDEQVTAMNDLTLMALSRRHPSITLEEIEDDLDIQAFFAVLCLIFAQNQALKKRF